MGELIFRLILAAPEIVFELACYFTARIIVPALSLGRYAVLPLRRRRPNIQHGRPIPISHETGALLGLLFWVLAIGIATAIYWLIVR